MERMKTGRKQKQNTVAGEELYAHGMRNRNGNIATICEINIQLESIIPNKI